MSGTTPPRNVIDTKGPMGPGRRLPVALNSYAPSVAQVGNNTVIAAAAPDNSLVFYWQPIGSETWNAELVASGQLPA